MIQIQSDVLLVFSLLFLLLPLDWIISFLVASCFHELCHILAVYFCGGKIIKVRIQSSGCMIETTYLGKLGQFFSILAGPAGSFALVGLCQITPKVSVCALFHGLFNFLPILPLDGGRMVRLLLYQFCPSKAERILLIIAIVVLAVSDIMAILFFISFRCNSEMLVFILALNIRLLPRKTPCKASQIRVQYT